MPPTKHLPLSQVSWTRQSTRMRRRVQLLACVINATAATAYNYINQNEQPIGITSTELYASFSAPLVQTQLWTRTVVCLHNEWAGKQYQCTYQEASPNQTHILMLAINKWKHYRNIKEIVGLASWRFQCYSSLHRHLLPHLHSRNRTHQRHKTCSPVHTQRRHIAYDIAMHAEAIAHDIRSLQHRASDSLGHTTARCLNKYQMNTLLSYPSMQTRKDSFDTHKTLTVPTTLRRALAA